MKLFNRLARRDRQNAQKRSRSELHFDVFEERVLLSNYLVNSVADSNTGVGNDGTLRYVLTQLPITGTATNEIAFDIAGSGLQMIVLGLDLPSITQQVTINGYTEPGASANTHSIGTNAVIQVQLNLNGHAGLVFNSGAANSVVEGLSIFGGAGAGISINDNGITVSGDFLGVQADGTTVGANATGVSVASGATVVQIGSTTAADRNLISGNTIAGVSIAGTALVQGNLIGTDATGLVAKPNAVGVVITGSGSSVGGSAAGAGNTIAHNTGDGVQVSGAAATGDLISQNLIFSNTGLDIDLRGGANGRIATPTVLAVASVANLTTIDYQVTGTANQTYTVEFFASSSVSSPAAQFLGSVTTPLSASPRSFTATFSLASPIPSGQ